MADAGLFYKKAKVLTVWQKGDARGLDAYMEGLEPAEGDTVIVKKYASAFFGTTLASELQVLGVDTLVICGVSTSGCVRASTLDAMQHGFRPMVSYLFVLSNFPHFLDEIIVDLRDRWWELLVVTERLRFTSRICLT